MIFNISSGSLKTPVLNTSYPANATVNSGTNATFKVEIAEQGIPNSYTYQWYVNDKAVSGATGSSYTRNTSSDKGAYSVYCKVTNIAGTVVSRTATLTVNKTPVLNSAYPANASVVFNTNVTSKVEISTAGNPASYTYQWYKNGTAVSGATSSTYTFKPTAIGTTTLYCKVTNAAGTVTSRTATITATSFVLKPSERAYSTQKYLNGEISVSGDTITFGYPGNIYAYSQWLFVFADAIDVSPYSVLKATVNVTTVGGAPGATSCLAVTSKKPSTYYDGSTLPDVIAKTEIPHTVQTHEVSVTLSSVSQSVYVVVCGASVKGTITNIRLE